MIKILYANTEIARSADTLSTPERFPERDKIIAGFGGNAIYVRYWGGRAYYWFVAKNRRALAQWKADNGFVGQNEDAFRQYCDPSTEYFFKNEELFWDCDKFATREAFLQWRKEVFA